MEIIVGVQLAARVTPSERGGLILQIVSSTFSSNAMDSRSKTSNLDQTCASQNEDEGQSEIDDDVV